MQALDRIAQALFDKKGFNILALDVREVCSLTDYFIIAEGNVDKHVMSLGDAVVLALKEEGIQPVHTEGRKTGDWIVLDFGEIVVHLFMPGIRDKYRLEELWREGKVIDLGITVTNQG